MKNNFVLADYDDALFMETLEWFSFKVDDGHPIYPCYTSFLA